MRGEGLAALAHWFFNSGGDHMRLFDKIFGPKYLEWNDFQKKLESYKDK